MKGFISYARKDQLYFDLLVDGIKSQAAGKKTIEWEFWTDHAIVVGEDWHEVIQEKLKECEFAILLLSANFFASAYIQEFEFSNFLQRKKKEGFLIFPVLLRDVDISRVVDISRIQCFGARGEHYGMPQLEGETIPYDRLVEKDRTGSLIPNSYRETYHKNLVIALEEAIRKHNQNIYYRDQTISRDYGIASRPYQLNPLQEIIRDADLKSAILMDLHRVNCDRVNLIGDFWRFFEQNKKLNCQFFVIPADNLHQPLSFAERLIYELKEDKSYSIYFKPMPLSGITKHPVSLHLTEKIAKNDFLKGFSKMASPEQEHTLLFENLDAFLDTDPPAAQYDYIALIFDFGAFKFPEGFSLRKYLDWIREDFCKTNSPKTKLLFFCVFSIPYRNDPEKKDQFHKVLHKFAAKGRQDTLLLSNFSKVKITDLVRWFNEHLVDTFEAEEIVDAIIAHLDENYSRKMAERFFDKNEEAFQMAFVEKVLKDVINLQR